MENTHTHTHIGGLLCEGTIDTVWVYELSKDCDTPQNRRRCAGGVLYAAVSVQTDVITVRMAINFGLHTNF